MQQDKSQNPRLPRGLKIAVIGHIEWVSFISVNKIPISGEISHCKQYLEEPAGGGAVAAVQIANLTSEPVHFITSLGKDNIGEKCYERLTSLGLKVSVAWRDKPTRKAISLVTPNSERAITVIGERLQPSIKDDLPWEELKSFDGVFITAADKETIELARMAKVITATPRVGLQVLRSANIQLDALIGSAIDPAEKIEYEKLTPRPKYYIGTEGKLGGFIKPGGRYDPTKPSSKEIDSYGCGDSFAGALTTALAADWSINNAVKLAASCGAECSTYFGPYNNET